ncbi:MAG: cytochrome c oxidase subunit 3 [Pseudomonadota bacterium]|nr:cytochrome c oxidase subunit 3 [Pseudomonadota bacterium]
MVPPSDTGASAAEHDYHGHKHPYPLVDPSPWPFIGSVSGFVMAIGAVMYMHAGISWVLILGVVAIMGTMAGWFWEVVKEAEFGGYHNPVVQVGMRYGMVLFIASEVMFFVAWFWAYFNAALFPTEQIAGQWPPPGVQTFDTWDLPFLNTLILLMSGITVTWAHHALRENNRTHFLQGLALTIFLGVCFTGVQAFEYSHAAFGFQDGIYPSTFYMATGFHGFHVLVGTIFLIVCFFRGRAGHFTDQQHFGFEAAAWYWHFVDVVWLFLFVSIYWWGR